jgi:rubrerythrin
MEFLEKIGDPVTGLPIGSIREVLATVVASETLECTEMYPRMAQIAREEGFHDVADWFETLTKAERSHANRYTKALASFTD